MKTNSNRTFIFAISSILILALLSSCATMFSGSNQNIKVKSLPEGANIYINGQNTYYQTPHKVKVKRRQKPTDNNERNELNIEVRKEGFENTILNVESSFNPISGGSILLAGVPFLVDLASGAHLKYPKTNYLYLEPIRLEEFEPRIAQDNIKQPKPKGITFTFKSDIDYNIPQIKEVNKNRFALIIGNEDYASFQDDLNTNVNVKFARNDAISFKEYAISVMGIPEENITFLTDATLAKMKKGLAKMNLIAKNSYGEGEFIFYYAGHGLPHEKSKEAYLLPVDVSGKDVDFAIGLDDVYKSFSEFETKKITCFLDCCFSGGARDAILLESRAVRVVPKKTPIKGNMVVYAASSAEQTALAYDEQKHGLFTYFLLKKFKEDQGQVTYGELEDYLLKNLPLQSVLINEKEQLPQVNSGSNIDADWKSWKF